MESLIERYLNAIRFSSGKEKRVGDRTSSLVNLREKTTECIGIVLNWVS